MTRYEKRDHLGYFIDSLFLVRIVSAISGESNGVSFVKKRSIISRVIRVFLHPGCLFLSKKFSRYGCSSVLPVLSVYAHTRNDVT